LLQTSLLLNTPAVEPGLLAQNGPIAALGGLPGEEISFEQVLAGLPQVAGTEAESGKLLPVGDGSTLPETAQIDPAAMMILPELTIGLAAAPALPAQIEQAAGTEASLPPARTATVPTRAMPAGPDAGLTQTINAATVSGQAQLSADTSTRGPAANPATRVATDIANDAAIPDAEAAAPVRQPVATVMATVPAAATQALLAVQPRMAVQGDMAATSPSETPVVIESEGEGESAPALASENATPGPRISSVADLRLGSLNAAPVQPIQAQPATAPAAAQAAPVEQADLNQVIDRLVEARQAARSDSAQLTVAHDQFGRVSMKLEAMAGGALAVTLGNADPEFAPAVHAALAERPAQDQRPVAVAGSDASRADTQNPRGDTGANGGANGGGALAQGSGERASQQAPSGRTRASDQSTAQGSAARGDRESNSHEADGLYA